MMFDLYVISYDTTKTETDMTSLWIDFTNKSIDLDVLEKTSNVVRYSKILTNLKSNISSVSYDLSYKKLNKTLINTGAVYRWTESGNIKSVAIIWVKKFDKNNYIAPIMATLSDSYLITNNYAVNLEVFFAELNSASEYKKLSRTFNFLNV